MLTVAISPYHLTSRELPAMTALLLADAAITALPVPRAGVTRNTIQAAFRHAPRYLRLIESWRWGTELWRDGTIVSDDQRDGQDPMSAFARAMVDVFGSNVYTPLRDFIDQHLLKNDYEALDRICADVLKGGPDPGISVPMAAGLDAFAAEHGAVVARLGREMQLRRTGPMGQSVGSTGSLAQRAEEMFGQTVFSLAMPVLLAGGGEVVAEARILMEPELQALRLAVQDAFAGSEDGGGVVSDRARREQQVRRAAAEYAVAFERHRSDVVGVDDEWGERVTAAMVKVVGRRLPVDAAFRSSIAALRTARQVGLVGGVPVAVPGGVSAGAASDAASSDGDQVPSVMAGSTVSVADQPARTVNTLVVSQLAS